VIHLSGENVAGMWTDAKKKEIYESRVKSTGFLVDVVSQVW
jgi:NAD dependent epimerase/dehydratase family enzyme